MRQISLLVLSLLCSHSLGLLRPISRVSLPSASRLGLKDNKDDGDESNWTIIKKALEEAEADPKGVPPPIYEPGPYTNRALAALAYVVPIVDAADLGKYMFEAYPVTAEVYNTLFGPLSAIYNGVPFLPFAVFFLLSYVCRAPTFPVEIRFHVAQAFMLSLFQFIPSLLFGLLEKGGVPGMGVLYNTGTLSPLLLPPETARSVHLGHGQRVLHAGAAAVPLRGHQEPLPAERGGPLDALHGLLLRHDPQEVEGFALLTVT